MWKVNRDGSAWSTDSDFRLLIDPKTNAVLLRNDKKENLFVSRAKSFNEAAAIIRGLVYKFNSEKIK